jgi:hypothetical protein
MYDRAVAADARRLVAEALAGDGLPEGVVADARAVVNELVVEALVRGWTPSSVILATGSAHLRIDVVARGRQPAPHLDVDRRAAMGLVERLAVKRGSQPFGDGRRWWAVLALADG